MAIVLRENEWAAEMIKSGKLGKKPSETLRRIARYYLDAGYSKCEARDFLDKFLLCCDSGYSLPKWSDALDTALRRALKYPAIDIDGVDVTYPELEKIATLDGKPLQRLAFTLLCLSKYWEQITPNHSTWVNEKDCDIMAMANVGASIKRQCALYSSLQKIGFITFSKRVDNTHVCVNFKHDGEIALHITDFRNLGYQYLKYLGEPYFECENCGLVTKINSPMGRRQKYCAECAVVVHMRQKVDSAMRRKCPEKLASKY